MTVSASEVRWVYIYLDANDAPLYVGCTVNLDQRHENHRSSAAWFADAVDVRSMGPFPRATAFRIETALIKALQPAGNTLHTGRDPRKAGNWTLNLPPGPYRVVSPGGVVAHFANGSVYGWVSDCGLVRGDSGETFRESAEPADCRACLRAVSIRRERSGLAPGRTWLDTLAEAAS